MAVGRSLKSLLSRRRRADEEGEDDDGPVMVEDSQSEGSVLSEQEDDDADASTLGGGDSKTAGAEVSDTKRLEAENLNNNAGKKARKSKRKGGKKQEPEESVSGPSQAQIPDSSFKAMADTQVMMNGMNSDDHWQNQDVLDFESLERQEPSQDQLSSGDLSTTQPNATPDQSNSRSRRDNDDGKKRRDADPAFIPSRGNFFMHDTRTTQGRGGLASRGAWGSRGRGRGSINPNGPVPPINRPIPAEPLAEQPWKHDLHDTINEEPTGASISKLMADSRDQEESARIFHKGGTNGSSQRPPTITFSNTTIVGKVSIRVSLPGMKEPSVFLDVPWKHYTRLPDHRPPLRRDKPVRIFLAPHLQRYIFPSMERSFIFIPRQMRPNQQGFGRSGYQRSIGGYGYSSRRTSMYGGSIYAASNAQSRRSSFASVARDTAFSPVGSFGTQMPPTRPIVRLPHGSQSHFSIPNTPVGHMAGYHTPTRMQMHTYDLPQQPTFQGTPTTTMHQPRPQKAISVGGIESPAAALQQQQQKQQQQAPVPLDAQPFQNQLPQHMTGQSEFTQPQQQYFSPRQQYLYPSQPQSATPLSGIPEQMVHAQPFQPSHLGYGPGGYYNGYPAQQPYYYPQGPNTYQPLGMYVPMMSPPAPIAQHPPQTQHQHQQPHEDEHTQAQPSAQSGMLAHEKGGTTFYIAASEAQKQSKGENYQPAESFVPSYAMPGLPPPTPGPESQYYYPPIPLAGMQEVTASMYFPSQPPPQQQ